MHVSCLDSAIIAPDGRDAMQQHAAQLAAEKIPFIFDPGQGLPMFDGAELTQFIDQATWMALNDYEARMLCERTGRSLEQLSDSHLRGVRTKLKTRNRAQSVAEGFRLGIIV